MTLKGYNDIVYAQSICDLGAPFIVVTKFLVQSPIKPLISNHNFSSHQNVLYNTDGINISN